MNIDNAMDSFKVIYFWVLTLAVVRATGNLSDLNVCGTVSHYLVSCKVVSWNRESISGFVELWTHLTERDLPINTRRADKKPFLTLSRLVCLSPAVWIGVYIRGVPRPFALNLLKLSGRCVRPALTFQKLHFAFYVFHMIFTTKISCFLKGDCAVC
jgi:hypothetical protein